MVLKHPWLVPHIIKLKRIFPKSKIIIIWRHPYDVIASTLDFVKNDKIANSMFGTKLKDIIQLYKNHINILLNEKDNNNVLNIRFEDFIQHTNLELEKCFDFLGVPVDDAEMYKIVNGDKIIRTARVLDDVVINKPKRKFFTLKTNQQKMIVKHLNNYAQKLGYDTMKEILKDDKK
jgi:hypothetical protein